MPSMPRASVALAGVATALVLAAVLLGALSRILSATEHHAFATGAVAPGSARVILGQTYTLSVPGGVKALQARGADVGSGQCQWSVNGSASQALPVAPAGEFTKATNVVATFVAPYTGDLHVECVGWGPMFLDNAEDTGADNAGWFLVLATISLTVGVALGMAALRSAGLDSERAAREDDEVQRLVRAVHLRSEDREIARPNGGDVLP